MARYVISDANPLIGLVIVDGLAWLPELFAEVWIPTSVQREVLPGLKARGGPEIAAAIMCKALRAWKKTIPLPAVDIPELDAGETDCIRLALSVGAASVLILMDERAGRAVAIDCGIPITGTAAVISLAKRRCLIASAKAQFEHLHATDFRISATVIQATLRAAGEL